MEICNYGCGKESQFVLGNGKFCCSIHCNKCEGKRNRDSLCKKGKPTGKKGMPGHKHSEETKLKLSKLGRESNHRRLVKSTRFYQMKNGQKVLLDSSWEEILAKRLDELNINWIRPIEPLIWIDLNNLKRNYFPDFYLVEYDMYLDPKNPYAYKVQKEKIDYLLENFSNVRFLTNIDDIKNFAPVGNG